MSLADKRVLSQLVCSVGGRVVYITRSSTIFLQYTSVWPPKRGLHIGGKSAMDSYRESAQIYAAIRSMRKRSQVRKSRAPPITASPADGVHVKGRDRLKNGELSTGGFWTLTVRTWSLLLPTVRNIQQTEPIRLTRGKLVRH